MIADSKGMESLCKSARSFLIVTRDICDQFKCKSIVESCAGKVMKVLRDQLKIRQMSPRDLGRSERSHPCLSSSYMLHNLLLRLQW